MFWALLLQAVFIFLMQEHLEHLFTGMSGFLGLARTFAGCSLEE
jgi:hypothetical protein